MSSGKIKEADFVQMSLTQGKYALVDIADYALLEPYNWHTVKHLNNYYARANMKVGGKSTSMYMHRFITGVDKGLQVDHVNHDGLDNRRSNLRICTISQNNANRRRIRRSKTSPYKGVHWDKGMGKWRARMNPKPKAIHLGFFDDEKEAAKAYDRKAVEIFGKFAHINFPELGVIR